MELSFLGATGTVTGSKYLLRAAGRSLMLDCGLFQGGRGADMAVAAHVGTIARCACAGSASTPIPSGSGADR